VVVQEGAVWSKNVIWAGDEPDCRGVSGVEWRGCFSGREAGASGRVHPWASIHNSTGVGQPRSAPGTRERLGNPALRAATDQLAA
jgi:hypothetical protein